MKDGIRGMHDVVDAEFTLFVERRPVFFVPVDGRGRNALPDTGGAPLFRSQEALYKYYKEENENLPADAGAQES